MVVADEERERDAAVLEWTIRNAIDQTLAAKGYQRIVAGDPDFLVDFGIRLEEKSTDTFGEYIKYRDEGGKQGLGSAFVFGYEQGSVAIEITDARSNAPLWTGSERIVLDDGQDVSKIEGAANRILAGFPGKGVPPRRRPRPSARLPRTRSATSGRPSPESVSERGAHDAPRPTRQSRVGAPLPALASLGRALRARRFEVIFEARVRLLVSPRLSGAGGGARRTGLTGPRHG